MLVMAPRNYVRANWVMSLGAQVGDRGGGAWTVDRGPWTPKPLTKLIFLTVEVLKFLNNFSRLSLLSAPQTVSIVTIVTPNLVLCALRLVCSYRS